MNMFQRLLPWLLGVVIVAYLTSFIARPGTTGAFDLDSAGRILVSADGRVKPLDTFARNSLLMISGKQTMTVDGKVRPAIEWLLEVIADPEHAAERQVFRIDHPDIVAVLGLEKSNRVRFSFKEVREHIQEIDRQAGLASQLPAKKRDPFQRQMLDLENRVVLYEQIGHGDAPHAVAPLAAGEEWQPLAMSVQHASAGRPQSAQAFIDILSAFSRREPTEFNSAVRECLRATDAKLGSDSTRAGYEVEFNRIEPFYQASVLYVLAFMLACAGLLFGTSSHSAWARSLTRSAIVILGLTFALHTVGLVSRMYLQGRPPVTNLYSSAVFIGWACIPIAMVAERFFRLGFGSIVASLIGFATLIVAHNLAGTGDTMEMMQAVLDSNFWLATHVVVVTIGYSATFLAGFVAAGFLILGSCTGLLRGERMKALPKMTYGIICFASVTSFVGTVLGGIWADQSWGRFWGWDPKENGAALIVLMNLLTLHARWGGMVKERGVAVLAVLGNIITAWSWFGTNMLGVGLHSYGFMDSAVFWLLAFCGLQLVVMCIGFVSMKRWRSVRPPGEPTAARTPVSTGSGGPLASDRTLPA